MITEQIRKNIQRVAPLPANIRRIMSLVNDDDADMGELAKVVEEDPTLTLQALNLCSSAYYAMPTKVSSVSHAVRFLGTETVGGLAMAAYFRGLMMQQGRNKPNPWLEGAGNHLLLTAQIAEKLARSAGGMASPAAAFTAGLLHDVGKLVFSKLDHGYAGKIGELVLNGKMAPLKAEKEVLGVDHTEVGADLAKRWKVPEEIVEGILKHHAPLSTDALLPGYVFLADALFYLLKQDIDLDAFLERPGVFQAMEVGGLTGAQIREAVDAFRS